MTCPWFRNSMARPCSTCDGTRLLATASWSWGLQEYNASTPKQGKRWCDRTTAEHFTPHCFSFSSSFPPFLFVCFFFFFSFQRRRKSWQLQFYTNRQRRFRPQEAFRSYVACQASCVDVESNQPNYAVSGGAGGKVALWDWRLKGVA